MHQRNEKRTLFVTHQNPDFDAHTCGTLAFLRNNVWFIRGGKVAFVGPNDKYEKPALNGHEIVHGDVGGQYDPANNFFDHHIDSQQNMRERWPSSARMIFENSPEWQNNQVLADLVYRTDLTDSGRSNDEESNESCSARSKLNAALMQFNVQHDMRYLVVSQKRGPHYLPGLLANLEITAGELSDEMKMKIGMHLLRAWINQESDMPVFKKNIQPSSEIPDNCEYIVVLPSVENLKNDIALFLWQQANEIEINDKKVGYVFVNPGDRFSGQAPPNAKIVHIGTGQRYNPENNDYDSAGVDNGQQKIWYSPAIMIFHKYRKIFMATPTIFEAASNLVRLTKNHEKSPDVHYKDQFEKRIKKLNDKFGYQLKLINNPQGPYYLTGLFAHLEVEENELSNRERLEMKLYSLNGWYNQQLVKPVLQSLMKRAEQISRNNLNFIIIPETFLSSKTIRRYLRAYYKGFVDVCIANYQDPTRGFGITRLFEDGKVAGMDELFNKICDLDTTLKQRQGIYKTDPEFAIYLTKTDQINFEKIRALTIKTLRSSANDS